MYKFSNKYPQFLSISLIVFISACAGLTNKSLEKGGSKDIQAKSVEKPVDFIIEQDNLNVAIDGKVYENEKEDNSFSILKLNKGIIESFNGDIDNWWVGEGGRYSLETQSGALKVIARKVGPRYDAFGRPFNGLDFTGAGIALRVRARSEGEKTPVLRIDVKDANGYVSNGKPITNRIVKSDKFTDYYFKFDHKLMQKYPTEAALDAKAIKEILFFVNGGGNSWSGTLFIDDVVAVPIAEAAKAVVMAEVGSEGGYIDDFKDGIYTWWGNNSNQKIDSPDGKTLNISAKKIGPAYDAFGRSFDPFNFTNVNTIRVRAKVESDEVPNVRLDIKDVNEVATNAKPNIVKFDKGNVWTDYYFPFKGRFTQTWPNYKKVDPTQIITLLFMVNAGKSPWSGKMSISEVEVIKPIIDNKNPVSASGKEIEPSPSTLPGVVIDNFEDGVDSWWMGTDRYIPNGIKDKMMQITCKDVGAEYETFGKGFSVQDFSKTPILVVRAMVDGDVAPSVRVDAKDADGRVANISPIILPYKNDGKFYDYIYDYRGKFSQTYPDVQTMDPAHVQELIFFVNPGGPKVSTNIYIEDVKALTPEEFDKISK